MSAEVKERLAIPGRTVELVKGEQWEDDLSGISLFRGLYKLASRDEMLINKSARELGYIKTEETPTAILPEDKNLDRVEKALRAGILKIYDPKKPVEYKELTNRNPQRAKGIDGNGDFVYNDKNDVVVQRLLKMSYKKFQDELSKIASVELLEKLKDGEISGKNPTASPRKAFIDAIERKIKSGQKVSGVTKISEERVGVVSVPAPKDAS